MRGTCSGPHQAEQVAALLLTKIAKATKILYLTAEASFNLS